jgi:paraquat-inducible protein B
MDSKGVQVETESLISILAGGIAFEGPGNETDADLAAEDQVFPLFKDRASAMKTPSGNPQKYVMYFNESLRGLVPGSTVEFQGIPVGQVSSVEIRFDEQNKSFSFPVTVAIYEDELGLPEMYMPDKVKKEERRLLLESLINRGLRAQLRSGSLITGQLYIALEFFPDSSPARINWSNVPLELPTTPGTVQAVEQSVTSILKKIDRMPLNDIGLQTRNSLTALNETTQNLNKFIERLNKDIAPEAQGSLSELKKTLAELKEALEPNSPLQRDLRKTLKETTRSAQTIRDLADTLEAEPESLIKGKKSGDSQ